MKGPVCHVRTCYFPTPKFFNILKKNFFSSTHALTVSKEGKNSKFLGVNFFLFNPQTPYLPNSFIIFEYLNVFALHCFPLKAQK